MKILLNNKIELNENSPLPFCNGDLLFFINQDKTIKLDMFSEINNSEIELLSLIYPNKLNIPLERIKKAIVEYLEIDKLEIPKYE